jgi:hypothetical protein
VIGVEEACRQATTKPMNRDVLDVFLLVVDAHRIPTRRRELEAGGLTYLTKMSAYPSAYRPRWGTK